MRGAAIECRVNAEDPVTFAPWPGKITGYSVPGRLRRAGGLGGVRELHRAAALRLAAGQAHRPRRGPRHGHPPDAARAGRVRDGGHPHQHPLPPRGARRGGLTSRATTTPASWSGSWPPRRAPAASGRPSKRRRNPSESLGNPPARSLTVAPSRRYRPGWRLPGCASGPTPLWSRGCRPSMDKNKIIEGAAKLVAKGAYDKAIKEYQKVLEVDPRDVRVLQKMGELYQKKNDNPQAASSSPRSPRVYSPDGFFLKAVALYKQVLKLNPNLLEVNLKLAELHQQLGLMTEAMAYFQVVVANHYDKAGDTKATLDTLKKMVDLDPENVAVEIKLAELYAREKMGGEAADRVQAGRGVPQAQQPPGRLAARRGAPRLARAGQRPARHGAGPRLPRPRGPEARAGQAAGLLQGGRARRRDADPARAGVPGARPDQQDAVRLQGAGEAPRRSAGQAAEARDAWGKIERLDPSDADLVAWKASHRAPAPAARRGPGAGPPGGPGPDVDVPGHRRGPGGRCSAAAAAARRRRPVTLSREQLAQAAHGDGRLREVRAARQGARAPAAASSPSTRRTSTRTRRRTSSTSPPGQAAQATEQLLNVLRLCTRGLERKRAQPYLATILSEAPGAPGDGGLPLGAAARVGAGRCRSGAAGRRRRGGGPPGRRGDGGRPPTTWPSRSAGPGQRRRAARRGRRGDAGRGHAGSRSPLRGRDEPLAAGALGAARQRGARPASARRWTATATPCRTGTSPPIAPSSPRRSAPTSPASRAAVELPPDEEVVAHPARRRRRRPRPGVRPRVERRVRADPRGREPRRRRRRRRRRPGRLVRYEPGAHSPGAGVLASAAQPATPAPSGERRPSVRAVPEPPRSEPARRRPGAPPRRAGPSPRSCDEASFFLDQGLLDEAREMLETVELVRPGATDAPALLERLAALEAAADAEPATPPPPPAPRAAPPGIDPVPVSTGSFDLAAELADELEELGPAPDDAAPAAGETSSTRWRRCSPSSRRASSKRRASPRTWTRTTTWASPTRRWASWTTRCRSSTWRARAARGTEARAGLHHDDWHAPGHARRAAERR